MKGQLLDSLQTLTAQGTLQRDVQHFAAEMLRQNWLCLSHESGWLVATAQRVLAHLNSLGSNMRDLAENLHSAVQFGHKLAQTRVEHYRHAASACPEVTRNLLRVGLGSPSCTGCMAARGDSVKWSTFTDCKTGILQAFRGLDLDMLALPGARLPQDFKPPEKWGLQCVCHRGANYDSCAVFWRSELRGLTPITEVGGPRRVHILAPRKQGPPLVISAVYLPPDNATHGDEAWCSELKCLSADLCLLQEMFGVGDGHLDVLLIGDMNIQPSALGAGPDRRQAREAAWNVFTTKHKLAIANPGLQGSQAVEVELPLRGKTVLIRPGDTHHHPAGGASRAIDLVLASQRLVLNVTIHNSLQCCSESQCTLPLCHEYTRGDHFLVHADLSELFLLPERTDNSCMPNWLHDEKRWNDAWKACATTLGCFAETLDAVLGNAAGYKCCQCLPRHAAVWLGNAAAWVHALLGAIALDGWVVRPKKEIPRCAKTKLPADDNVLSAHPWLATLGKQCDKGEAPCALAQRCFRLLKADEIRPPQWLLSGEETLTGESAHKEWCRAFVNQSSWPNNWALDVHEHITHECKVQNPRSWSKRGKGSLDQTVTAVETQHVLQNWDRSRATTPDLIPRAAYTVMSKAWGDVCFLLVKLTGPGCLALKPDLWRRSLVVPKHKQGFLALASNWRFLEVRSQIALLHESVFINRLRPLLTNALVPGQSGYVRDVSDAHLLLHEVVTTRLNMGLPTLPVFGDLAKAFPRTWRDDFLTQISLQSNLQHGGRALLADILAWDSPTITLAGFSRLMKTEGVPEGGVVGPAGFNTWLNSLTLFLLEHGHGVGLSSEVPGAWRHVQWSWCGVPDETWVTDIRQGLLGKGELPSVDLIQQDSSCMASCLRAMDLGAPSRLVLVLHADDPVLLSSSSGAAQAALDCMAKWAFLHKAAFHVGPDKTVALVPDSAVGPGLVMNIPGKLPCAIHDKQRHRWLGLLWPADLDFLPCLSAQLGQAGQIVANITGLMESGGLPLCFALMLFEAKVEGLLRFGRWLLATCEGALDMYDKAFNRWSCALLGSPPWRSPAVAHLELGWQLMGRHRAVLDVAKRRAKLWCMANEDIYAQMFRRALACPDSWSAKSLELLKQYGVPDFPEAGCCSLAAYASLVRSRLCSAAVSSLVLSCASHSVPFPWSVLSSGPSSAPASLLRLRLPWSALVGHRALCQLRAGTVHLSHVDGHRSAAKVRCCVFCGKKTYAPYIHVLGECFVSLSPGLPDPGPNLPPRDRARLLLNVQASNAMFADVAHVALMIVQESMAFWTKKRHAYPCCAPSRVRLACLVWGR